MIEEVVKHRMGLAGLTQAKLAEQCECTATQMGLFLKGNGFLNKTSFEKCLAVLGIRVDMYEKRYQLAFDAALKLQGYRPEEIIAMTKLTMASKTGFSEINCFIDVNEKELDEIVGSEVIDYECTFPYFKAMVLHLMQVGEKSTPKAVEMSFSKLAAVCALIPAIPLLGMGSIIGMATGMLLGNKIYSSLSSNALSPLMVLTKTIVRK